MQVFIVTDEREHPIGVYVEPKQAEDAKSLHEKKGFGSRATVSAFNLEPVIYVLCKEGHTIGGYSTLENARANAVEEDCHMHSFILDAAPA